MDFQISQKTQDYLRRLGAFMDEHVYPNEERFYAQLQEGDRWQDPPLLERAEGAGPRRGPVEPVPAGSHHGAGLTNLEYAPLERDDGHACAWRRRYSTAPRPTPATWRCSSATARRSRSSVAGAAARRGDPLGLRHDRAGGGLAAMPPTSRAPSCATVTRTSSTGASGGPRARATRAAGSSSSWARPTRSADRHRQQSMILVPRDAPGHHGAAAPAGVRLRRCAARAHGDRSSRTCACPRRNMLLGEGRGFEIAQGRLGPGASTTACGSIGVAERALEKMCRRVSVRIAFGKPRGRSRRCRSSASPSRASASTRRACWSPRRADGHASATRPRARRSP